MGQIKKSSTDIHTLPCVKQSASGKLLSNTEPSLALCDNLEGWDEVWKAQEEGGIYVQLWLIHAVVLQKPKERCKAISLQLKKRHNKAGGWPTKAVSPRKPIS